MPKIPNADLVSSSPIISGSLDEWGQKLNNITELTEDKLNEILVDLNFVTGVSSIWNAIDVATYNDLPLVGEPMTMYYVIDENKRYLWGGSAYVNLSLGEGYVTSINNRTGDVLLSSSDVGLSNVDNTSDLTKITATTYSTLNTTSKTVSGAINEVKDSNDNKQPLDSDLTALAGVSSTGIIVRTGSGTATTRSIATSGVGISVTNGDGVSANPTIVSNATSSNTANAIVSRNADGNFNAGTITATLNGSASTLTNARTIGIMTGDITSDGSSFNGSANNSNVATIGANKVTNSKLAQMPTMTIKGNDTVGNADPQDLTVPEVQTMIQDSTHRFVTDSQISLWNSTSAVIKYYGTKALAIADESNISLGDYIQTFGASSINDGGGSLYIVASSLTDGFSIGNGKYANYLVNSAKTVALGSTGKQIANIDYVNEMLGGNSIPGKSLGTNGYVKMANGLIIQWGRIAGGANSSTFPLAFPTVCCAVTLASFYQNDDNSKNLSSFSNTGFTTTSNYGMAMHWHAIGY